MQVYNVRRFHALDFLELRRQRSLQYLTLSQFFSHFLRQAKGRWHTGQVFSGRKGFLCITYTTSEDVGLFEWKAQGMMRHANRGQRDLKENINFNLAYVEMNYIAFLIELLLTIFTCIKIGYDELNPN